MNKTDNYELILPGEHEPVLIGQLNDNSIKIDKLISELNTKIEEGASGEEVESLKKEIDQIQKKIEEIEERLDNINDLIIPEVEVSAIVPTEAKIWIQKMEGDK